MGERAPGEEPASAPQSPARRRAERAAAWIVPEANPAGVVYGIMLIGALMAAESGHHESHLDTILSALIATGAYWLLHAYSHVLGRRLQNSEPLTGGGLWRALVHEWAIVRGAAIPLFVLLVGWIVGASQEASVSAALLSAVASLICFELAATIRSRASAGEFVLQMGIGLTMGLAILGLRVVLI